MVDQMTFEHVLDFVGSSGRWQFLLFLLTSMAGFFNAFHSMGSLFLAASPNHWCSTPEANNSSAWGANWTAERVKEYTLPYEEDTDRYSSCYIYKKDYSNVFNQPWEENILDNSSSATTERCSSWTYDHSIFASTVVTQWDLVCNRAPLAATVQATYMLGVFMGTLFFGLISDRFGRCFAILIAVVEVCVGGLLAIIPIHYVWFVVFRIMTGMGIGGVFSSAFVLMAESISPSLRDVAGIAFQIPFGLGYMVLPLVAYYIRSWMTLQLAISLLSLFLIIYFWLMPESPRWLILHDRCQEAFVILRGTARVNKQDIVTSQELYSKLKSCNHADVMLRKEEPDSPSALSILFDLFRTPQMRKRILVSYFAWFVVSLCYYGLSFLSPIMGNDIYAIAFLTATTEIPSYILGCFTIRYLPRRLNVVGTFIIGGLCCLLILAVPSDNIAAVTGLAITGKFFINITYAVMYLYATEIFPTKNRNVALGTSSMCARVGAAFSPYIVDLMKGDLPLIIFGTLTIIAGLLCLLLPETKDKFLPQTISDVENGEESPLNRSASYVTNSKPKM